MRSARSEWRAVASPSSRATASAISAGSTGSPSSPSASADSFAVRCSARSVTRSRIRKRPPRRGWDNHGVTIPEISTARLLLRRWRHGDRAPFAAMNADPAVMEHFPNPLDRGASDDLVGRIVGHWAEHGFGLWAIERRDDRAFLGFTGLAKPSFDAHFTPAVEVGWRLAREAWGYGFAT